MAARSTAQQYLDANKDLRDALCIPRNASLDAVPLAQGEHNENFWFTDPATGVKYVLRINHVSQMGFENQIRYEYDALEILEESGRTPQALYVDDSLSLLDHGVLVMQFCPGGHLDYYQQWHVDRAARLLADVHAVAVPRSCPLVKPEDPLRAQFDECLRMFTAYRESRLADAGVTRYVERFFEATSDVLDTDFCEQDCAHILNTEAISAHFLIPEMDQGSSDDVSECGAAGYVVDWEKPIIGEVAQDVAYFLAPTTTIWDTDFIFTDKQREHFVDQYWQAVGSRFDRGCFDARYRAYMMSNCLRGTTWSCAAWVEYHDPDRPLKNAKTFEKLKVYLSEEFLALLSREVFGCQSPAT